MKRILAIIIFLSFLTAAFGQISDSSINIWQVSLNYSFQLPGGNMADRFGINSMVGPSLSFKTKNNWIFGVEASYVFGGNIKAGTSMLDELKTSNDQIINEYGEYGSVILSERGFYAGGNVGKVFPIFGYNPNSGLIVNIGAGLLQHKINLENKDNNTPPILNDYKKGYDKLTNGLTLKQFIGYQHLSNNRMINFYFGIEFYQGFTQSRRSFDFETRSQDTENRLDLLYGIRVGWILPLYQQSPENFYYY